MERELWSILAAHLTDLSRCERLGRYLHSTTRIVRVYLWAALHDRPVYWACERRNWVGVKPPRVLPDQTGRLGCKPSFPPHRVRNGHLARYKTRVPNHALRTSEIVHVFIPSRAQRSAHVLDVIPSLLGLAAQPTQLRNYATHTSTARLHEVASKRPPGQKAPIRTSHPVMPL